MIRIDTGELALVQSDFNQCNVIAKELIALHQQMLYQQSLVASNVILSNLKNAQLKLQQDILSSSQYFQSGSTQYQNVEKQMQNIVNQSFSSFSLPSANTSITSPKNNDNLFKTDVMKFTHRFHSTFNKGYNLVGYLKNGVCVGAFAGFDVLRFRVDKEMKYLKAGADIKIGSASIAGDAKAMLYQDGKFDPALQLEANANATLAQVGGYLLKKC